MSYSNRSFFQNSSGRRETRPREVTERFAMESTGPSVSSASTITSGCFRIESLFFFLGGALALEASVLELGYEDAEARAEGLALMEGPLEEAAEEREDADDGLNLPSDLTLVFDAEALAGAFAARGFGLEDAATFRRGGGSSSSSSSTSSSSSSSSAARLFFEGTARRSAGAEEGVETALEG